MSRLNNLPKVLETHSESRGYLTFRQDLISVAEGKTHQYHTISGYPYAVIILPITAEGDFVLLREYRHPTGQILIGCPGGGVNEDEDPLDAARRELLEETGHSAESFTLLGTAFPLPGLTDIKTFFVRAAGAYKVQELSLEPAEYVEPIILSRSALQNHIQNQTHIDSSLFSALFLHG